MYIFKYKQCIFFIQSLEVPILQTMGAIPFATSNVQVILLNRLTTFKETTEEEFCGVATNARRKITSIYIIYIILQYEDSYKYSVIHLFGTDVQ